MSYGKNEYRNITLTSIIFRFVFLISGLFDSIVLLLALIALGLITIGIITFFAFVSVYTFDVIGLEEGMLRSDNLRLVISANSHGAWAVLTLTPAFVFVAIKRAFFSPPTSISTMISAIFFSALGILFVMAYQYSGAMNRGVAENLSPAYRLFHNILLIDGKSGWSSTNSGWALSYMAISLSLIGLILITISSLILIATGYLRINSNKKDIRLSPITFLKQSALGFFSRRMLLHTALFCAACMFWSVSLSMGRIDYFSNFFQSLALLIAPKNEGIQYSDLFFLLTGSLTPFSFAAALAPLSVAISNFQLPRVRFIVLIFIGYIVHLVAINKAYSGDTTISLVLIGFSTLIVLITPALLITRTFSTHIVEVLSRASTESIRLAKRQCPPIILLRPFNLDNTSVTTKRSLIQRILPFFRDANTIEEIVATTCFRYAPIYAVGKPGETLPPLGAIRDYLNDSEWQQYVQEMIRHSQRIVFIAGAASFTRWESLQVINLNGVDKLIVVIPPDKSHGIHYFRENPELAHALNLSQQDLQTLSSGFVRCIVGTRGGSLIVKNRFSTDFDYRIALQHSLASDS